MEIECSSTKKTSSSELRNHKMPQGMALEIVHHPLTMRQVVNLVIAMDRLKTCQSEMVMSSEFRDEDLLNILLESAVDEQLVLEITEAAPPEPTYSQEAESPQQCTLTDTVKRSLVLMRDTLELHAVRLQGGSKNLQVSLNMSTYLDPMPSTEAQPVALGIRDTKYYLSCSQGVDRPTLNLEEVHNKDDLKYISKNSDMARFLFYKRDSGLSVSSLMSARYAGWYISTAPEDNLPVDMCKKSASRYQSFTVR